ncbi:MAG: DUF6512 family protein [candidate division WOR-3 bacterium]
MRRKIFIALIFLALFAAIHLAGDLVPVRLPFFGTSESVWEHLKMGWWSYGLAYGISWAITRKGSLAGLFTGTLLSLGAIFIIYYTSLNLGAVPGRLPLAADIAIVSAITFLSGLIGAEASGFVDSRKGSWRFLLVTSALWALLLVLFVVYTYNAPPFDLFQEPPLP